MNHTWIPSSITQREKRERNEERSREADAQAASKWERGSGSGNGSRKGGGRRCSRAVRALEPHHPRLPQPSPPGHPPLDPVAARHHRPSLMLLHQLRTSLAAASRPPPPDPVAVRHHRLLLMLQHQLLHQPHCHRLLLMLLLFRFTRR